MTNKNSRYINEIISMGYRPVMRLGERVYEISKMKMLYRILIGNYVNRKNK